jgi:hypothetical protein
LRFEAKNAVLKKRTQQRMWAAIARFEKTKPVGRAGIIGGEGVLRFEAKNAVLKKRTQQRAWMAMELFERTKPVRRGWATEWCFYGTKPIRMVGPTCLGHPCGLRMKMAGPRDTTGVGRKTCES